MYQPSDIKLVIFDLDETLINSFPGRLAAVSKTFSDFDIQGVEPELFLRSLIKEGWQIEIGFDKLGLKGLSGSLLAENFRRNYYLHGTRNVRLYPGVESVLQSLKQKHLKLAVITQKRSRVVIDGHSAGAVDELSRLGILDLFDLITGFEEVTKPKPHPEGILKAMSIADSLPYQTLVIGDSDADIKAAISAGCWSCRVTWGLSDPPSTRLNEDFLVHSVDELTHLLFPWMQT